jgi:hypothetical protein
VGGGGPQGTTGRRMLIDTLTSVEDARSTAELSQSKKLTGCQQQGLEIVMFHSGTLHKLG